MKLWNVLCGWFLASPSEVCLPCSPDDQASAPCSDGLQAGFAAPDICISSSSLSDWSSPSSSGCTDVFQSGGSAMDVW